MQANNSLLGRGTTVDFIVGGSGHGYAPASNADLVVAVDSSDELARLPDRSNLIKVPLGDHDTVLSLLERLEPHLPEAAVLLAEYRTLPNIYLSSGMAQDPRLGVCAVKDLELKDLWLGVFETVTIRLLEATNGKLTLVTVREINGNAGGRGPGGPHVGNSFIAYLEERTNVKMFHQMIRFGGITYASVAKRADANTGMSTLANVETLLAGSHARRTRSLDLIELPLRDESGFNLRGDRTLLDQLAATLLQARLSAKVSSEIEAWEANHKWNHPLAEIRRVQAKWSKALESSLLKRAGATHYRDALRAVRHNPGAPDMRLASAVEVRLDPRGGSPLPAVDAVAEAMKRGAYAPLLENCLNAPLEQFRPTVLLVTSTSQLVSLDQVLGQAERPRGLEEARSYLRRFDGVIAHPEAKEKEVRAARDKAETRLNKQRAELARRTKCLNSLWRHVDFVVQSRGQIMKQSSRLLEAYRNAHQECSETSARVIALESALQYVRGARAEYDRRWLGNVETALTNAIADRPVYLDTVQFRSVEEAYLQLLETAPHAAADDFETSGPLGCLLVRMVAWATLKGLAAILDTSPEPESIIAALAQGKFSWEAPFRSISYFFHSVDKITGGRPTESKLSGKGTPGFVTPPTVK